MNWTGKRLLWAVATVLVFLPVQYVVADAYGRETTGRLNRVEIALLNDFLMPDRPPVDSTNAFEGDHDVREFGEWIFFSRRFSLGEDLSCATCHIPELAFSDGRQVPKVRGREGRRNTLGLWNLGFFRWYSWDGKADSLWSQAIVPILRKDEFGADRKSLGRVLCSSDVKERMKWLFAWSPRCDSNGQVDVNTGLSFLGKSLAAYMRTLTSRDSPFDRFARKLVIGDQSAYLEVSNEAIDGYRLFVGKGRCSVCHRGPLFSDGEFHDIGVPPRKGGNAWDSGRYEGTKLLLSSKFRADSEFSDDVEGERAEGTRYLRRYSGAWGQFRTPSLRNVEVTGPYMHEGQMESLREVVEFYSSRVGALQVHVHSVNLLEPRRFSQSEMASIVEFLRSLTDISLGRNGVRNTQSTE